MLRQHCKSPFLPLRATSHIVLKFFQELGFFLKFLRPLTFPPGESHHPTATTSAVSPILLTPTLFTETKSNATSPSQAAQGQMTWSHPPGEASPVMCLPLKSLRAKGVTGQAFPKPFSATYWQTVISDWRKPRPSRSFFSMCIFCFLSFFCFFFCKMSQFFHNL